MSVCAVEGRDGVRFGRGKNSRRFNTENTEEQSTESTEKKAESRSLTGVRAKF